MSVCFHRLRPLGLQLRQQKSFPRISAGRGAASDAVPASSASPVKRNLFFVPTLSGKAGNEFPHGSYTYAALGIPEEFVTYLLHTFDQKLEERCLALPKSFGLRFSAIDLVVRPDREVVFLELNPNGQWGWIEEVTGLPIIHAIADLLR
jgi:hypothetical protein